TDLAAGADEAPARPLYRGRPALDRSVDPGIPHPAGGPGADGAALDPPDLSARVSATVGPAPASPPAHAPTPVPPPGRGDDCARDRGESPAPRDPPARGEEKGWGPAVRRRVDQDGLGIGPAAGRPRAICAERPLAATGDPDHAARFADGAAGSPRDG